MDQNKATLFTLKSSRIDLRNVIISMGHMSNRYQKLYSKENFILVGL